MCIMKKTSNIIAKIKQLFAEEKFATDYTAATGEIIRCLGDSLAVGEKVVEIAADKESPLFDGSYLLDNGKSIVVAAGEIKEINEVRSEGETNPVEMGDMADKMEDGYTNEVMSKLVDGTEVKVMTKGEALSVGDMVMVKSGEEFVKAPEGRHELEGGLVIYTDANGLINELETKETEEDDSGSEEMKTMFQAIVLLKQSLTTLSSTINEMKSENTDLKDRFNKFAAEPSVDTITKKKENVAKMVTRDEKLKFLSQK